MDLAAENIKIGIVLRTVMRLVEVKLDEHGGGYCAAIPTSSGLICSQGVWGTVL